MILRLTATTADLMGETGAEWELLEKQTRAGRWISGPRTKEGRLRALAADLGVTLRVEDKSRPMLAIRKTGMFSSTYTIADRDRERGSLSFSGSTRAEIRADGESFDARRRGFWNSTYVLERDDREVVTAEAAGTGYDVRSGSNVWNVCREGWASTTYVLMKGDSEVGRVERAGVFSSGGSTRPSTTPFPSRSRSSRSISS
jgi:hypothetical protein